MGPGVLEGLREGRILHEDPPLRWGLQCGPQAHRLTGKERIQAWARKGTFLLPVPMEGVEWCLGHGKRP